MNNAWLEDYLEHLGYEVTGLICAYVSLVNIIQDNYGQQHPLGAVWEQNDSLDLLVIHFRSLHEFFCDSQKTGYIRASNYVEGFKAHRSNLLASKSNLQTAYLTQERHEISLDLQRKAWKPKEVTDWLIKSLDEWTGHLTPNFQERLDKELYPVLEFIRSYPR